jgi:hypothetical protein
MKSLGVEYAQAQVYAMFAVSSSHLHHRFPATGNLFLPICNTYASLVEFHTFPD